MNGAEWYSTKVENLSKDTVCLFSHNGMDATRNSRSNGLTMYHDYNVLKLLKSKNHLSERLRVSK